MVRFLKKKDFFENVGFFLNGAVLFFLVVLTSADL